MRSVDQWEDRCWFVVWNLSVFWNDLLGVFLSLRCKSEDVDPRRSFQRTLTRKARRAVTDFIVSKNSTESHYRRARTQKKYFDSNESMRKIWGDFVTENPNSKSTRSPWRNTGPVISFSTFRNIFQKDLSDLFSFRKARVDTCQFCDETINKINILSQSQGDQRWRLELTELREAHSAHCKESEVRFASMIYDMNVLSNRKR